MNRDLSYIRQDFTKEELDENKLSQHPVTQFKLWLNDAIDNKELEPTAMTLSTVSPKGIPSGRIVLLKKVDAEEGFRFFTNYESKKGLHLKENNYAALNFFWPGLERQVRIEGTIEKILEAESDEYFKSRPKDSQVGATISPQSQVINSREELESWFEDVQNEKKELSRPVNWGGYTLRPFEIEFWQGRAGRLHDRIRYTLTDGSWLKERLAP
ncbi:pyridoxamine 5'-phosphate oxidase [Labilibacter sediminis]|nr:pyridoxamine 5'-phosphate oxidase [Labilibacter sediminis]